MKNTQQHRDWIPRMGQPAARAALVLAAVLVLAVITTQSAQAQFTLLHSFDTADGPGPKSGLIQTTNGFLYGAISGGGANGQGAVFKITPAGKLTTVYSFCPTGTAGNCVDASFPGLLTLGNNGNIYGTLQGGINGTGAVFTMTPAGAATAAFFQPVDPTSGDNAGGADPVGALIQGTNGDFYGVTNIGGVLGQGVAWESPLGGASTEDLAQFFCNPVFCNRGYNVEAGLVQGTDGNFYGVSANGGTGAFGTGQLAGSVFQIDSTGTVTTLYSFCSLSDCSDGQDPTGALVQGADGNFYGTTTFGGNGTFCGTYTSIPSTLGCGTVFEITPSGTLTTLYSFCSQSNCADGIFPGAGLIQATDGNFYGTTTVSFGSSICSDLSCGTIFQITPAGTLTTLFSFCSTGGEFGCASGALRLGSNSPLMQATNGDFYGTTTQGGSGINNGTVFSLSVGLGPFVETLPNSGQAGTAVKILGTDLTGATSVSFNGTAAVFDVVSASEITTKVPAGATIGLVTVTTPSGTLTSNQQFRTGVGLLPGTTVFAAKPDGTTGPAKTITLTNLTASTITSISPSIGPTTNAGTNDFSFAAGGTCSTSLAASSSCTYLVTFTSSLVGAETATLSVTDSVGTQTATLKGVGIGAALLPATTVFASEPVGTASPAKTITLFNYTASTMSITSAGAIGGTNAADFSITGGTCVGLSSLAASSNCTYTVTFTSSLVVPETATLSVTDSVGIQTATLKGTGIAAALLPATTTFATEPDGTTSPAKTITLGNLLAAAMSITGAGAIGGANAADFSITGGTCVPLSSLPSLSSCTYTVTFTPSLVGAETASLSVNTSVGIQTAKLKGTGTP
jgi:uncharacterized repeat protein (TIGR03803 family)